MTQNAVAANGRSLSSLSPVVRLGATSVLGMWALGACAVGAIAVGYLAVRQLEIRRARVRRLIVDDLLIKRLRQSGEF